MIDWIKKNKDLLTAVAGLLIFVLSLSLLGIFFKGDNGNPSEEATVTKKIKKVDLPLEQQSKDNTTSAPQTSSFFLKPSPAEIMSKFTEMDSHQLKVEAKKLPGLRVMWPTYFFSILKKEAGTAALLLDTTEDGFGVTIVCDVDISKYPQIQTIKRGEKLWIAGEIIGIDPEGVGQIFITTEQLRFAGDKNWPQAQTLDKAVQ